MLLVEVYDSTTTEESCIGTDSTWRGTRDTWWKGVNLRWRTKRMSWRKELDRERTVVRWLLRRDSVGGEINNIMPYGLCCAIGSQRENIIRYRKYLVLSLRGLFLRRIKKQRNYDRRGRRWYFYLALTLKYVYRDNSLNLGRVCVEMLGE